MCARRHSAPAAGAVVANGTSGFSAYGSPVTVALTPAGGNSGDPITWGTTAGFDTDRADP